MCKNCVQPSDKSGITLCITKNLHTPRSLKINNLRTTNALPQLYNHVVQLLVHIKISLTVSVLRKLSTVSTEPITKTTTYIFNILLIKYMKNRSLVS